MGQTKRGWVHACVCCHAFEDLDMNKKKKGYYKTKHGFRILIASFTEAGVHLPWHE